MPELPKGEHGLRDLALRFVEAEGFALAMLAQAAVGDRKRATRLALEQLVGLRLRNYRPLVADAYVAAHPNGEADAVKDLASSLTKKLDTGIIVASDSARQTFKRVTLDTIDDAATNATAAHIDKAGTRWSLGRYATMTTETIGRTATSRGVADAAGQGSKVRILIGECQLCHDLFGDGETIVGRDPMPPGHVGCSCVPVAITRA